MSAADEVRESPRILHDFLAAADRALNEASYRLQDALRHGNVLQTHVLLELIAKVRVIERNVNSVRAAIDADAAKERDDG